MPDLQLVLKHLSLCLFAIAPSFGAAQVIPDTTINAAFAPVSIVEDHPACQNAGDTAFRVAMRADGLHFRLGGPNWQGFIDVQPTETSVSSADCSSLERRGADVYEADCSRTASYPSGAGLPVKEQKHCYITERKGSERVRRPIPCEVDETKRNLNDLVSVEELQLNVEGEVTICQSLTSFHILEGQWSAVIAFGDETVTYDGQMILPGAANCRAIDPLGTPRVGISYSPAQAPAGLGARYYRQGPTFLRLWMDRVVVPLAGTEGAPVLLETGAVFFPTVDGQAFCPLDGCAIDNRESFDVGEIWWHACR